MSCRRIRKRGHRKLIDLVKRKDLAAILERVWPKKKLSQYYYEDIPLHLPIP